MKWLILPEQVLVLTSFAKWVNGGILKGSLKLRTHSLELLRSQKYEILHYINQNMKHQLESLV